MQHRHPRLLTLVLLIATTSALAQEQGPRWQPQYKIKPHQKDRLTAADVVGPDGIVYPDWRYAGVPGGIPQVPEKARIEQFGGRADDDRDDSEALRAGAKAVAAQGGGALVLGPGTYHFDRPVILFDDGVVIRGQGMDRTKIVFRYGPAREGVGFFTPRDDQTIGPDWPIEVHAAPQGLKRIAIEMAGRVVAERVRAEHWGGTFSLRISAGQLLDQGGAGRRRLVAVAEWDDRPLATASIDVVLDPRLPLPAGQHRFADRDLAAIMFVGNGVAGPVWRLAQDGKRGDTQIVLKEKSDLAPGDAIEIEAPATERWNRLVQNACLWGSYRIGQFRVEEVSGNRVRLNQPLRIDFPVVDGSTARRIRPVRRCGVEDLSLEQTQELWTCGVLFTSAWECWARGLKVLKAGHHSVYTRAAKWCEIRDSVFDDAWYHGGGGTAYVGWERSYDCLMDSVTTWRMRHAPCVQWSSSGNVIRRSTFHNSDAQWHAGWTHENLFEQCVVDAEGKLGTYGHGGWASPPEDKAHGPEGPRNVVYNCDLRGPRAGLWIGGMNENWLILYNRIAAGSRPGIEAKTFSFDHIIRGNAIVLGKQDQPAVRLASADCTGVEILDNLIYGGSGRLVDGPAKPLVAENNQLLPLANDPPRPEPPVPSIFEWQRGSFGARELGQVHFRACLTNGTSIGQPHTTACALPNVWPFHSGTIDDSLGRH